MDFDGRYQLRELISEGNGGKLYHAVRREGEKEAQVLVKELSQEQGLSGGEELRLLSLSHPRLLSYEAVFEGRFLVMEELSGISLARELERMGSFPENEVISILSGICEGLTYLHGQTPPFVHGDLKPSNIIWTEKGPVIIDLDGSLGNTAVRTQGFGTNGYAFS